MRRIYFFIFVTIIFLYSQAIFSQETDEVSAEMMKVWMEYMTPGPMHEMMAKKCW
ncbi:MAG: hypothetical protein HXY49_09680 [Ignavibacteriaceae bacterium]|nr:hypothetical protein [Ignavibacteriaceae bacterium]